MWNDFENRLKEAFLRCIEPTDPPKILGAKVNLASKEDHDRLVELKKQLADMIDAALDRLSALLESQDFYFLQNILTKKQLCRKPLYQKTKELVRDVRIFCNSSNIVAVFRRIATGLRSQTLPSLSVLTLAASHVPLMVDGCEYLRCLCRKLVSYSLETMAQKHNVNVCIMQISTASGAAKDISLIQQEFGSSIWTVLCLGKRLLPAPSKDVDRDDSVWQYNFVSTRAPPQSLNMLGFLDYCAGDNPHLVSQNLGPGGEEEDLDDDQQQMPDFQQPPQQPASEPAPTIKRWEDTQQQKKQVSAVGSQVEVAQWLNQKKRQKDNDDVKTKEEAPSNSFFKAVTQQEEVAAEKKKQKKAKQQLPKNMVAPPPPKKPESSVSKADFLNKLLTKK